MIKVPAAVEDHTADSFFDCTFCNRLTDPLGSIEIAPTGATQILLCTRRRHDPPTELIVNHLRIDVIQAAINGQARPLAVTFYLAANSPVNRLANYCSARVCHFFLVNGES